MVKKIRLVYITAIVMLLIVFLKSNASAVQLTIIKMQDMHAVSFEECEIIDDSFTDSYGNIYTQNIIKFDASNNAYIEYELNGQYESFSGMVVASTQTGQGAKMNVAIFADGKEIWSVKEYTKQYSEQEFNLKLNGAKKLTIKTSNSGEYSYGWVFFVESSFRILDEPVEYNDYSKLREAFLIDSSYYTDSVLLMQDSYGELHDGYYRFDASNESYALFNLNQNYTKFNCSIVTSSETGNQASMTFSIYLDDNKEPSYTISGITKQSASIVVPQIDVSNVKVLKIQTSNEGQYSKGYVYLVDDYLSNHIHTPGEWVIELDATCTDDGKRIRYCMECGEICAAETILAVGHALNEDWIVTEIPTCTKRGKEVQCCSICNAVVNTQIIEMLGHTIDDEWIVIEEPTCTRQGKEVQYCSICNEIVNTQTIKMLAHTTDNKWVVTVEPSCINEGERVKYCTECGKVLTSQRIKMVNHSFGEWTTVSSFLNIGAVKEERACEVCGILDTRLVESPVDGRLLVIIMILDGVTVCGLTIKLHRFSSTQKIIFVVYHLLIGAMLLKYKMEASSLVILVSIPILLFFIPYKVLTYIATFCSIIGVSLYNLYTDQLSDIISEVIIEYVTVAIIVFFKQKYSSSITDENG